MVRKKFYVICYDIEENGARTKVSDFLTNFGRRANFSVFECMVTDSQFQLIKEGINKLIDHDTDSILVYRICADCYTKTDHFGKVLPVEGGPYFI